MPRSCDVCGDLFTVVYGLDCQKVGLVIKIRDAFTDPLAMAHSEVDKQPLVKEKNNKNDTPALLVDLGVCVLCQPLKMPQVEVNH